MPAHIYDIMAGKVPQHQVGGTSRCYPLRLLSKDLYYGLEARAKTCARFIAHHFGIFAPPAGVMSLDIFIAQVIYRTQYRSSTTFAALYLIGLLKERFQHRVVSDSRLTCHRLFLAAFMVVSKSIHDDTYSNKTFAGLATNDIATVGDINAMEREILRYIDWKVNIPNDVVEEFRRMVEYNFGGAGPYPIYQYTLPGAKGVPLQVPTTILSESPVPGALATRPAPPSAFLPPQPTVSYPPRRSEPLRSKRSATVSEGAPVMREAHSAPVSITLSAAGSHSATTYPPPPQFKVAAPVSNPYVRQAVPSRGATLPFPSHVKPIVCSSGIIAVPTVDKGWVVVPSDGPAISRW